MEELYGHPIIGSSWESFCIENVLIVLNNAGWQGFFIRNSNGSEIDLLLVKGIKKIALEFKMTVTPKPAKSFYTLFKELAINEAWFIIPKDEKYKIKENVYVSGIKEFIQYCLNKL